ncbi:hypothetical protein [Haemophilus influenzae]|uniref:hypothetical protein n=1 Tax=Haemophilus influenzae TaxID=727 RepID=UPI003D804A24
MFFLTLCSTITYGIWDEKEIVQYILLAFLAVELFTIIGVYVYFAVNNPIACAMRMLYIAETREMDIR